MRLESGMLPEDLHSLPHRGILKKIRYRVNGITAKTGFGFGS